MKEDIGTIKFSRTEDGLRIDISGDLAEKCCCCCGSSSEKSEGGDCCSESAEKSKKS